MEHASKAMRCKELCIINKNTRHGCMRLICIRNYYSDWLITAFITNISPTRIRIVSARRACVSLPMSARAALIKQAPIVKLKCIGIGVVNIEKCLKSETFRVLLARWSFVYYVCLHFVLCVGDRRRTVPCGAASTSFQLQIENTWISITYFSIWTQFLIAIYNFWT